MKIVESYTNGEPVDPQYTKSNRFWNGHDLIVFDDFLEYALYIGLITENDENETIIDESQF